MNSVPPIFQDEEEAFADFVLNVQDNRTGKVRRMLIYCREDGPEIPLYRFLESLVRGGAATRGGGGWSGNYSDMGGRP